MAFQHTLAQTARLEGVGLHTGQTVRVVLQPAPVEHGIRFVRSDMAGAPEIGAKPSAVNANALTRRTELTNGNGASVATIEHLLAALFAKGIDNARVELDGPEIPILDGSALPFVKAIKEAKREKQAAPRKMWRLRKPVSLVTEHAEISAIPAETLRLAFFADLRHAEMENQSAYYDWDQGEFGKRIAPARTFVFYEDLQKLRAAGLIRGGSLDCAIVIKDGMPYQTEYRLPNELACHKLLDLIGDLAILGRPVAALITARATGHALHHAFVAKLLEELEDND